MGSQLVGSNHGTIAMSKQQQTSRAKLGSSTKSTPKGTSARSGESSKLGQVETMLRHAEGTTIAQLVALLGWQPHSVRAAISALKKKGLAISSQGVQGGERTYRIAH